ncbi:hypothetical protein VJI77_04650 [Parvimonas sp. D2]|uniref:hypothetical protein n=1 Tax=unclassified Parvimonas TaxID=1151464 RepID=UPI002B464CFE|nr:MULTISPECIES: hypothetical protein [unclassified Parvimonas]MEB3012283.1 hypothetical protein [Parvimonas sp. D2]MEB3087772.1 hypothetical protein [Parvimonas sp. D4]
MKKRFLITALIICFCGALVSCKSKEQTEEKPKENNQVTVKEKQVKENIKEEDEKNKEEKKEEKEKEEKPTEEKKDEKGLNFVVKNLGNNDVKKVAEKNDKMSFDIYTVGMNFTVKVDGKEYSIKDAISKGILDEDKFIEKIEQDKKDNNCTSELSKDGSTLIYKYKDYSIVKYNAEDEDMYITKEQDLDSLEKILNKN